jgi:uncharacterized metal-binding protein
MTFCFDWTTATRARRKHQPTTFVDGCRRRLKEHLHDNAIESTAAVIPVTIYSTLVKIENEVAFHCLSGAYCTVGVSFCSTVKEWRRVVVSSFHGRHG